MSKSRSRSKRALANRLAKQVYIMMDPSGVNFWDVLMGDEPLYFRMPHAQSSAFAIISRSRQQHDRLMTAARLDSSVQASKLRSARMGTIGFAICERSSSGVPFMKHARDVQKAPSASFPPQSEAPRLTAN